MVLQYGDSGDHFPRIVFSLVKQKVSGGQEQKSICSNGIHCSG